MSSVIGWDIGGVHLKAARAEDGRVTKVAQYASPLRSGTGPLLHAFAQARMEMGRADRHIVTMTGELADTFASRIEGVEHLSALAARELNDVSIYAGAAGCVRPPDARKYYAGHCVRQLARMCGADRTLAQQRTVDRSWINHHRHCADFRRQSCGPRLHRRATAGRRGASLYRPGARLCHGDGRLRAAAGRLDASDQ